MNKSAARNLIIFAIVSISAGWIGAWVNTVIPSPSPQESLGILIFLLLPFITVFLLRGFGKDGWKDFGLKLKLNGNWGWYLMALLVYSVTIILTLSLGAVFGTVSFEGLMTKGFGALLAAITTAFIGSLIKNIAEEFSWRGYLTPRFKALGLSNFPNHMLTGLIWGLWHVPYWLFLLGPAIINEYSSLGVTGFIVMGLVAIFPTALVFGELRLKTGSLWPAFLAHNTINALNAPLVFENFISFKPGTDFFFSPGTEGFVMMVLFWAIGLWMLRKANAKDISNA